MGTPFHRAHARWPCDIEVQLFLHLSKGRLLGRGLLMDISLSGAFLRCDIELKVGSQYHLKASSPSAAELPFRVAREIPRAQVAKKEARHYGLTFLPSPGDEQRLRLLLDKLPRGDSLEQDKRARSVRGYWS